ncbi:hypothetical protein AXG93_4773s1070 [Marchantia polymorpha subsp. ruderalis]|uniref:Uncharacterized protein n=1 Tax=Marchantia polymorpha subsp. ruderalis TaxID=1480154 RepID=A0A176WJU5_MARPO|nr:hypothetical protein AXG93_4773s1070 [Marchantia polymorpha subsp. ruderalis]
MDGWMHGGMHEAMRQSTIHAKAGPELEELEELELEGAAGAAAGAHQAINQSYWRLETGDWRLLETGTFSTICCLLPPMQQWIDPTVLLGLRSEFVLVFAAIIVERLLSARTRRLEFVVSAFEGGGEEEEDEGRKENDRLFLLCFWSRARGGRGDDDECGERMM